MNRWHCLVATPEGRTRWQSFEAPSQRALLAQIATQGLTALELRERGPSILQRLNEPVEFGRSKLGLREQALLLTQLALLVRSSLPVDRSIELLRDQAARAGQRELLGAMLRRVRSGGSLASAIEASASFPSYVVGVVRAAERGGKLGEALTSLAQRITLAASTRQQLVTALTYPAAILAATVLALGLVLTQVIPQFEPIFAGEEERLPALTRAVLMLSRTVNENGLWLLLGVAGIVVGGVVLARSDQLGGVRAVLRRRLPGFGLLDQYMTAQFTGILSTLTLNGVSVVNALPLAREALGSAYWRQELSRVERMIREGSSLSAALSRSEPVVPLAVRLIEVGERTSRLTETCSQASQIIEEGVRAKVDRLVALANPIAIVVLGGLVGLLVAGVMLGIFALGDFAA